MKKTPLFNREPDGREDPASAAAPNEPASPGRRRHTDAPCTACARPCTTQARSPSKSGAARRRSIPYRTASGISSEASFKGVRYPEAKLNVRQPLGRQGRPQGSSDAEERVQCRRCRPGDTYAKRPATAAKADSPP